MIIEVKARQTLHEEETNYLFNTNNVIFFEKIDELTGVNKTETNYALSVVTLKKDMMLYFSSKKKRDDIYSIIKEG